MWSVSDWNSIICMCSVAFLVPRLSSPPSPALYTDTAGTCAAICSRHHQHKEDRIQRLLPFNLVAVECLRRHRHPPFPSFLLLPLLHQPLLPPRRRPLLSHLEGWEAVEEGALLELRSPPHPLGGRQHQRLLLLLLPSVGLEGAEAAAVPPARAPPHPHRAPRRRRQH